MAFKSIVVWGRHLSADELAINHRYELELIDDQIPVREWVGDGIAGVHRFWDTEAQAIAWVAFCGSGAITPGPISTSIEQF